METHLLNILEKMFTLVNAPTDNIKEYTQQPNWFLNYQWNKQQENEFVVWLTDYFKQNKEAFKLMSRNLTYNHKNRVKLANEFSWNYGWKNETLS